MYQNEDVKIEKNLMHQHNLPPGTLLHMDFTFINEISIRGFTAYVSVTCGTSGMSFLFPTRNKCPPLDIINFVVLTIRAQRKSVTFV